MSLFTLSNTKIFDKLLGKSFEKILIADHRSRFLDKATSPLLLEPDWESILQLCDIVKSQEVT